MNINIDGYNISYKISGEGDCVVAILQGWGTDLGVYDTVANTINDMYKVIQFDFPGFGGSDEPKNAWDVDAYADFFCHFMEALNIKRVTLLGHSYGGRVIIKLASRDNLPFEIDNIVLVDSAGIVHPKTLLQKVNIYKYKLLKKVLGITLVYSLFPELIDDWKSRQGSSDYRNASPIMRACLVKAVNEDLSHLLPNIKQDTLLIWGDKDTATPLADARVMEQQIPNAGLAVIKGAGHFPFLEQPVLFKNIMIAFFKRGDSQ